MKTVTFKDIHMHICMLMYAHMVISACKTDVNKDLCVVQSAEVPQGEVTRLDVVLHSCMFPLLGQTGRRIHEMVALHFESIPFIF